MIPWVPLASALPSPGMLNFLAGLFAGTGINLLTSAALDDDGLGALIVADSAAWVAAAACLTGAATLLQGAEREATHVDYLTEGERRELRQIMVRQVARRVVLLVTLTVVALAVALGLLPHLTGDPSS